MIHIPHEAVKPPNAKDQRNAARAFVRNWARPGLCWRVSAFHGAVAVLRFGGPDMDMPLESRTPEQYDLMRKIWQPGEKSL